MTVIVIFYSLKEDNVVRISKEEQDANVTRERQECFLKMSSDPPPKAGSIEDFNIQMSFYYL